MESNLFTTKLTEPQRLWLRAICSKLRGGEQVSARTLKVELRSKLPRDFDSSEIDYRLLANEDQITLLGIALLDPANVLVQKADLVINSVHDLLIRTPEIKSIGVDLVSQETRLPEEEVAVILRKLSRVGYFHDSGTLYGYGIDGLLTINIDSRTFDAYLKYKSLKEILHALVDDEVHLATEGIRNLQDGEDLVHANQLYDKVKSLIGNREALNENEAQIIVESADDAIKEFESTNQEKKVELKQWKAEAEMALSPQTLADLRKRAEGHLLKKSYPKSTRMRKIVLVLVGAALILLGLLSLGLYFVEKAIGLRQIFGQKPIVVAKLPELMLEFTNSGRETVILQNRGDLILWLPQSVAGGVRSIPGKYELLSANNDNRLPLDHITIPGFSSARVSVRFLSEAQLGPILEDGSTDLELILRRESGGIIFTGQIPFTRDALQSTRWRVDVSTADGQGKGSSPTPR